MAVKIPNYLKNPLLDFTDVLMSIYPRSRPNVVQLDRVRAVAHRGSCHQGHKENTLDAFRLAVTTGAWGIEFDVRWTLDGVPVVHHDASTRRIFGVDSQISDLKYEDCRRLFPLIPSFEEVVRGFGQRTHLMIEIKDSVENAPERLRSLATILRPLEPVKDYHLMSLSSDTLLRCEFAPMNAMLPIAEFNVAQLSDLVLDKGMGGLTSHYVLMDQETLEMHHSSGKKVGTGFVSSRSVFNREVGRDVDWIFTNHIQQVVQWSQHAR